MSLKTSLELSLIQLTYLVDNPCGQNEICTTELIMREYPDLFKGVGLIPGDIELHLKPDAVQVINAPRRIPVALRERFRTELTRMENAGIVAKVTCPTDWVNSFIIVEKSKTKLRICLDSKALLKRSTDRITLCQRSMKYCQSCQKLPTSQFSMPPVVIGA